MLRHRMCWQRISLVLDAFVPFSNEMVGCCVNRHGPNKWKDGPLRETDDHACDTGDDQVGVTYVEDFVNSVLQLKSSFLISNVSSA